MALVSICLEWRFCIKWFSWTWFWTFNCLEFCHIGTKIFISKWMMLKISFLGTLHVEFCHTLGVITHSEMLLCSATTHWQCLDKHGFRHFIKVLRITKSSSGIWWLNTSKNMVVPPPLQFHTWTCFGFHDRWIELKMCVC